MTFKTGQKVRIKGTDITGEVYSDHPESDTVNVEAPTLGGPEDFYILRERLEAVVEPITVTFHPVELPATVPTWFGQFDFVNVPRGYLTVGFTDTDRGGERTLSGKNINHAEARKLALAILTITDGPHGTEAQNNG